MFYIQESKNGVITRIITDYSFTDHMEVTQYLKGMALAACVDMPEPTHLIYFKDEFKNLIRWEIIDGNDATDAYLNEIKKEHPERQKRIRFLKQVKVIKEYWVDLDFTACTLEEGEEAFANGAIQINCQECDLKNESHEVIFQETSRIN